METFITLGIALGLGLLIGLQRERTGRRARSDELAHRCHARLDKPHCWNGRELALRLALYFGIAMAGGLALLWLWPESWQVGNFSPT
jgi:hypothetical protein